MSLELNTMNRERQLILAGASVTSAGIMLAIVVDSTFGGLLLVVGVGTSLLGLHRLGRSGPDGVSRSEETSGPTKP
jgi:hypothetical protein